VTLRWKKKPPERGLARIAAGPRGSTLREGDIEFASVAPRYEGWGRKIIGWYWMARNDDHGVPWVNRCDAPCPDEATAKAEAMAYVKKCLADRATTQTESKQP
jgi:hypothetical protein